MFLCHFLVSYRELKIHHPRAPCSHNPGYACGLRTHLPGRTKRWRLTPVPGDGSAVARIGCVERSGKLFDGGVGYR